MKQDFVTLEFDRIIAMLAEHGVSEAGKKRLLETQPLLSEAVCLSRMAETTAAVRVMENMGSPPLTETADAESGTEAALRGAMLSPGELYQTARFCVSVRRLRRYLQGAEPFDRIIAAWHTELPDLDEVAEAIERSVHEDGVLDDASAQLRDLRRRRERTEQSIREKLNQIMGRHKNELADSYITQRGGVFVVPVQKRYQSSFPGHAVDVSAKGNTVFMEPTAVQELRQSMDALLIEIDAEERRILWALSDRVACCAEPIRKAVRTMTELDVLFARGKLSRHMKARAPEITAERRIVLVNARHPLLDVDTCVPLSLTLALPDRGIAVTGPNTGGKTVCLKTLGLLTLMAQSGLHIPCEEGTVICMMDRVLCDIGDSQSISQNLSTFSGHITNDIRILNECSRESLVLLDEPGSGTDPAEGSGIAASMLEELLRRGCFFMATTHDPQIKAWAEKTPHMVQGRMAFDQETLMPLYRLELGLSGESCAIEIAKRLGMDRGLLARARQIADAGIDAEPITIRRPMRCPAGRLVKMPKKAADDRECFHVGDSVMLLPEGKNAIVYKPADEDGNVIVQFRDEKRTVRRSRLKLLVPASELYPPDYDFSIIFDTVANRKASHTISRKHDPNAVVIVREGTEPKGE